MEEQNMALNWKHFIFMALLLIVVLIFFFGVDFDSQECSWSKYNPSNVSGGQEFFGKCYVPYYGTYTSTTKCGFLGISCDYDVEPYVKMYSGTLCFKKSTGEPC